MRQSGTSLASPYRRWSSFKRVQPSRKGGSALGLPNPSAPTGILDPRREQTLASWGKERMKQVVSPRIDDAGSGARFRW